MSTYYKIYRKLIRIILLFSPWTWTAHEIRLFLLYSLRRYSHFHRPWSDLESGSSLSGRLLHFTNLLFPASEDLSIQFILGCPASPRPLDRSGI